MTELLPYELASLNNPDLLKMFMKNYTSYFFNINGSTIIQTENLDTWTHKILLNQLNDYLFIINENVSIISIYDCFPREYIKHKNIWYGNFVDKWNMQPFEETIDQCKNCCEYYYKNNKLDQCNKCNEWLCDGRSIQERVKHEIAKQYLLFPITNDEDIEYPMSIYIDNNLIHKVNIALANGNPDWWLPLDTSEYTNKQIIIVIDDLPKKFKGFNMIHVEHKYDKPQYDELLRPQLRFSQPYGWSNDPNGLVYHDGKYHLFYQSNPFSRISGEMYWGHAISTDLIHWTQLPLALHPHTMALGHCFSGSANVDIDNKTMIIAFTDTDKGECLARSTNDGYKWTCDEMPIIKHIGRDPKLIRYNDHWVIVVYEQMVDDDKFGFYISDDLNKWELTGYLSGFRECPEMIKLYVDDTTNEKWVIFGADSLYMIGEFNGKMFIPDHENKYKLHYGCFQASQCFNNTTNNRAIQIGWVAIDMLNMPFNQAFSLPLELSLKTTNDGIRLHAEPIKEIDCLRNKFQSIKHQMIDTDKSIVFKTNGQLFDILVSIEIEEAKIIKLVFGTNTIQYDVEKMTLNGIAIHPKDNVISFRIIVDKPMYEIFVNRGTVYNVQQRNDGGMWIESIELSIIGGKAIINEFTIYEIDSIWNKRND